MRRPLAALVLAAAGSIAMLGVVVFLSGRRGGVLAPHFHALDFAYLGAPLLLMAGAAAVLLQALRRRARR